MVTSPLRFIAACAFIKWIASFYAVSPATLPGDYKNNPSMDVDPGALNITPNTS